MLQFNYYIEDKMDKAWFESSNIAYAECDESDSLKKTVRIVFKNGSTYQYDDVDVMDWVQFKNSESQGKAFVKFIKSKGYPYTKLDNANIEQLNEEYEFRSRNGIVLEISSERIVIYDNEDNIIYSMSRFDNDVEALEHIKGIFEALGHAVKRKYIN